MNLNKKLQQITINAFSLSFPKYNYFFNKKAILIKKSKNKFFGDYQCDFSMKISKIIETINVNFLKNRFIQQSDIDLGAYKLNLNSRKIFNSKNELSLTEKESDIILFLKNSEKPVSIDELQTKVWGHSSKLDTHTVETHIYRLRKKISEKFMDEEFILNNKEGYYL